MENTKLAVCQKCWGTGHVHGGDENSTWSKTCEDCHGIGFVRVPKTNADRIRAMSDEELVEFAKKQIGCGFDYFPCGVVCEGKCETYTDEECRAKILQYLQQPADMRGEE